MTQHQVVVGAGAAGLMAAGQAAEAGADTLLLEKMNRPGRKLRITGKGRCNLTNVVPLEEFIERFGAGGVCARPFPSSLPQTWWTFSKGWASRP